MLGSYICRQCRARPSRRLVPVRTPQWQSRATFLSLRTPKSKEDAEPTQTTEQPAAQHQSEGAPDRYQDGPSIQYPYRGNHPQEGRAGRYSRLVLDDTERRTQPPPTHSGSAEEAATDGLGPVTSLESEMSYTEYIKSALSRGKVGQAWKSFEHNYTSRDCKALTEPSLRDAALLEDGKLFLQLLNAVNSAFCKGLKNVAVKPTAVLFKFEQLGIARSEYWSRQTIAYLTYQAIHAVNDTTKKPNRDLPSLLLELLSVWRLFFQCMGPKGDSLEVISTEWQLPAAESLADSFAGKNFGMRLQEYHPKYKGNNTLGFCAVYLFTISEALNSDETLQQQAAPLLQFLAKLLADAHVDHILNFVEQSKTLNELPVEVLRQIKKEIGVVRHTAMTMIGSKGEFWGGDEAANLEAFYLKRIARAVLSSTSTLRLESLWKQVEHDYTPRGQSTSIPPLIYNAFLSGFMKLAHSERSVDVWNHMIAHGVKPDMRSWVAVLDGCAKTRDLNGLNAMWSRMLSTGAEPDTYAWTARVNGLISLHQINSGLKALDEMGKRWMAAENIVTSPRSHGRKSKGVQNVSESSKAVNNCTKPQVQTINGAISALVKLRPDSLRRDKRVQTIQRILEWAGNFEIKPNTRTYNIMIKLYLQLRDYAQAFQVVRQMEQDGIESDIVTHIMLITAAFDLQKFDNLSAKEQTERIVSVFESIEASGIKMTDGVYGVAIDRLLKHYSNHGAVRVLVDHMIRRNLRPSSYVYTSLITDYFQQDPPAVAAMDSLVQQIFTDHKIPTDRLLFLRLIECYAALGEVGKMMSVLAKMSKDGRLLQWDALTNVVKALVEDGDMERARAIVRDVERGEGVAKGGVTGGAAQGRVFSYTVHKLGIRMEERMGDFMSQDHAPKASDEEAQDEAPIPHASNVQDVDYGAVEQEEDVHGFLTDEPEREPRYGRV
ncbi:uncharacterized protein K460DRAFT_419225 [Cucurbitaria berberidis CBS 394.84]|uniref:Pentatricopeptide repeat protein n=1 Tax=Cucurbitaria berberidis CBS 394.84 TaxID=1168544 RepID=A0A9P4L7G4_9PLEO|nr:uncharacterized protein K460DRAFT_419225 [Cucurbitaria berberidis CBS 394.84]KAF1844297.1 hypothetical protein K460DRAFT_419225 [Cucurbitaria berberidis CBS 394.84]